MCNNPMYRLAIFEGVERWLPPSLRKRIKNGGIIMDERERDYLIEKGVSAESIVSIPCGRCYGCMQDYQAEWVTRAMCESVCHKSNLFVTLTYNDEFINKKPIIHPITGEIKEVGYLVKDDFSRFIKRLRNYVPEFRFLCCGEYGDTTKRPHFHFLGFGLELPDLEYFYSRTRDGKISRIPKLGATDYYLSNTLSKAWGKGFVLVSAFSIENCSYVASYVNKKKTPKSIKLARGSEEVLDKFCKQFDSYSKTLDNLVELGEIESPFLHMSRRPGLGSQFIEDKLDYYYTYDSLPKISGKTLPKKHVRYFDNKLVVKDLDFVLLILKRKRKKRNFEPYEVYGDNGKEARKLREEKLKRQHDKKKPRDM